MYLLDTNILSYWMRGNEAVLERLKRRSPAELSMSVITLAEILYGIEKSAHRKQERRSKIELIRALLDMYAFDQAAASEYAIIRAQLESQGLPISERDVQIASIALANDLTVVTHNVKEFGRVKNLVVEDWANQDDQLWRLQND
jgi:tRNA(fMet)-specific endonuclease VapC